MTGKARADVTREWIAHALRAMSGGPDIPEDAEVVGVEYNAERDVYECVLTSEEFDNVPEGAAVPRVSDMDGGME